MRVATVFSGIGAIEHALETAGIEYDIVFACDNGDINPFDLKVKKSFSSITKAFQRVLKDVEMYEIMHLEDNHGLDLSDHTQQVQYKYEKLKDLLQESALLPKNDFNKVIQEEVLSLSLEEEREALEGEGLSSIHFEVEALRHLSKNGILSKSDVNKEVKTLQSQDLYKDSNALMNYLIQDLNMLNERIKTALTLENLDKMETLEEEKEYIDALYSSTGKKNYVQQSYLANYNISDKHFHQDARFLNGTYYEGQVDLFVGGSPCQSFSLVGKRRGLEDTRGTLFYEYARLVKEIKPRIFIYENVRGLLSHDDGETWKTMQAVFDELGYSWKAQILNAKDYGIPQNRERIFVVGFRNDLPLKKEFYFPEKILLDHTMQDYLSENVSGKYYLNQKGVDFVTDEKNIKKRYTQISGDIQLCQKANQQFNWHGDFIFVEEDRAESEVSGELEKYFLSQKVEKYVMSSGTKSFYSKPEIDLEIARPLLTTMHKMHRAGVDNYVTTSGRIRKLTPRETLRLMGFCDSFKIVVSDTQMYRQAGNSIVVNVLLAILKSIYDIYPKVFLSHNSNIRSEDFYQKSKMNILND